MMAGVGIGCAGACGARVDVPAGCWAVWAVFCNGGGVWVVFAAVLEILVAVTGGRVSALDAAVSGAGVLELVSLVSLQPCRSMPPMTTTCTVKIIIKALKKKVDFPREGVVPWGTSGFGVFIMAVNLF
jgi:hypothetical protein